MVYILDENFKPFSSMCSGRMTKMDHTPPPPLSKNKRRRDIEHDMGTGSLIWDFNSATVSYLIRYDSLSQNATDIITNSTALL